MEGAQYSKMSPVQDVRQCDAWGKYLNSIGWKTIRTSGGILMAIKKLLFFSLIKIQKPTNVTKEDLEEIERIAKKENYFLIKLEPFLGQDEKIISDAGYSKSNTPLSVPSTMVIDLDKDEKYLWEKLSHSAKYSINRSKREGSQIRYYENPTKEAFKIFYEVFSETAKKQKFYKLPYEEAWSRSISFGRKSYLIMAYDKKGVLMCGKLFLANENLVLYSLGGTTEAGRKAKSGYELLWQSFLYFKGLGYKALDLEGLDDKRFPFFTSGWGGFSHFKEKFGGIVVRFPHPYVKFSNKMLSALNKIAPMPI
jgi:lipid II:glycine glycyltransferase (peptidoglycan interpeptide bridge formation enzyme)